MSATLRVIMGSGATWDDPSEDALLEYLKDVERGDEEFIIVERTADASGQTYAQAVCGEDGAWIVERRDGSADKHFTAECRDLRAAHEALTAWAFERDGWQAAAAWEPTTV